MNTPDLVEVLWEDIVIKDEGTWVTNDFKEHSYTPQLFTTVGYLLHSTKKGIILTDTYSDEMISPRDQIPRGAIISIKVLKKGAKRPTIK